MKASGQKSLPTIGFLTVTRDPEHGLFGGYLVLNALGRPLEFHCTAPVRPNRAQEILYGPTLDPYLFGERIGQTLLNKPKATPKLAFTDVEPVMAARAFVSIPLTLVLDDHTTDSSAAVANDRSESVVMHGRTYRRDPAHPRPRPAMARLHHFDMDGHCLAVVADHLCDVDNVTQHWALFADQIDLQEPFGRIREAIGEARGNV